jgi:hypothetical protein
MQEHLVEEARSDGGEGIKVVMIFISIIKGRKN